MSSISPLRSWYESPIDDFLSADTDAVLGVLTKNSDFDVTTNQLAAWRYEISCLRDCAENYSGHLFLEFNVPRMGSRVDAVLILGAAVFVLEFKVGAQNTTKAELNQVWDYALDLKNFHHGSHDCQIFPILIATETDGCVIAPPTFSSDQVAVPFAVNGKSLRRALDVCLLHAGEGLRIDPVAWARSSYHPTPTIIEAARALYSQHSVSDIARTDAGALNLQVTLGRLGELIEKAQIERSKIICFVTGVPGAGKTLVGLDLATQRSDPTSPTHAVLLSGNGPLVAVLREALARDEVARRKARGERIRKGKVENQIKAFIQNVHHFRDEALIDSSAPDDRVAIFDEAQRAWNTLQTASFMRRRRNRPDFNESEPEFLIRYMDRHPDWAAIVCLVGGGQEINVGEAGISGWLEAIENHFPRWHVHISPNLTDSEYGVFDRIESFRRRHPVLFDPSLHLAVSMRSFRAENVSAFVKALLDCESGAASQSLLGLIDRFPIVLTRSLNAAKDWVRARARGSERFGLVASSKALRLKAHAIDVRVPIDPVHWFLNEASDTRSSYYLEDAATEFQVQGLELDWVCVTWDADLRMTEAGWSFHDFHGSRWTNVRNSNNRRYLKNSYRVLLTRARQGMVVFVPPGDQSDLTRLPEFYDGTFEYLVDLGLPVID